MAEPLQKRQKSQISSNANKAMVIIKGRMSILSSVDSFQLFSTKSLFVMTCSVTNAIGLQHLTYTLIDTNFTLENGISRYRK